LKALGVSARRVLVTSALTSPEDEALARLFALVVGQYTRQTGQHRTKPLANDFVESRAEIALSIELARLGEYEAAFGRSKASQ
jgi:hypothetical protein